RIATVHFRLRGIPRGLLESDVLFAALGHLVGRQAGTDVPVIDGVEHATEDQLKALGAAAASAGAVAMFHIVGITPEAPTLADACGGRTPRTVDVRVADLAAAAQDLTSAAGTTLGAVSIGTPHFSLAEFETLLALLDGRRTSDRIEFFVSTGRDVLAEVEARGWLRVL